MSEHTPGPWAVTHEDDFDGLVIEAAGREGEYVPVACVPVDYDDRPEREANAALIARAPEMAAEIERLTARVDELEGALAVRPRKPRRNETQLYHLGNMNGEDAWQKGWQEALTAMGTARAALEEK